MEEKNNIAEIIRLTEQLSEAIAKLNAMVRFMENHNFIDQEDFYVLTGIRVKPEGPDT